MELVEIVRCESSEPWWTTHIQSSSDPDRVYTILVPDSDSEQDDIICECLGFIHQGHCKHQAEVFANLCRWDELIGPEEQEVDGVCPRCGSSTVTSLEIA
jgi:hypothetical protein